MPFLNELVTKKLPTPQNSVVMRASFINTGSTPLKQLLATDNVPLTVQFNAVNVPSADLTIDLATGEGTAVSAFTGMASISCAIMRELTGVGATRWGIFIETYNGTVWQAVAGSQRAISLSSIDTDLERFMDFTFSLTMAAGTKFRFRHFTSVASRQVSLVALAPVAGLPGSSGALLSFWGIKP